MNIVFNPGKLNPDLLSEGNKIIHAYPACQPININGVDEYFLEGYGTEHEGLNKITLNDILLLLKTTKRLDIL